ncbi:TonB-dependent outer membrane receptor, SusC/RagA subfamily, signature region [Parapedobacter composti]|uniref:TonB-dependent outer membrane receptor, SusC/RagA subfamily, signature region n=1 Tax=Parapedobacter composti TaxID=623281 RepID=A0A1I1JWZ7_9SPHI|nr:M56 family metallopeptidase [Parapedobacter composti]SFC52905.1 TonB-dependent outer membrane receptor, SusC/RagA subfamily, signature region [Parapedobacter composti]
MPELLVYLLKANLALALFYLGYRLLLRKLTFYYLNRVYLLFAWVFSLIYPVVDVGAWLARRADVSVDAIPIIPDWQGVPAEAFSWWPYVMAVFWLGVAWFAIRLIIRLMSLWYLHRGSRSAVWRLFRFRQVSGAVAPFSFWRNIYVNPHQHGEVELGEIFRHEQVHIDELHTADMLVAEVCSVLCWFNPGAWLVRHAVHENLEFITDRRVLRSGADRKAYQHSLLRVGQYGQSQPLVGNRFNFKSLKRRIMMMNKKESSALNLGRYLLAIPVIAVLVLVFTVSRAYQDGRQDRSARPETVGADMAATRRAERDTAKNDGNQVSIRKVPKMVEETTQKGVRIVGVADTTRPLIVVDGEVFEGDLDELNPNDIASISVLKDASTTKAYGSRGAKGVVLITTKARASRKVADTTNMTKDTAEPTEPTSVGRPHLLGPGATGVLYIVDGKEVDGKEFKKLVIPDSIATINVLKDEAAVKKYGEKGAKGVVEIRTKQ